MNYPYRYTVIDNATGKVVTETNTPPLLHSLQTYVQTSDPNVKVLRQTRTVYIDTRYAAKLRLWNYVMYTRKGLPIPRYQPYAGTEIGKSIPILNF